MSGPELSVGAAILGGGSSRRFGSEKAVADAGGQPLAGRVRDALRAAGLDPIFLVGGDQKVAALLELPLVADQFPGEGPLGGTATALNYFTGTHVLVTACDLPLLRAEDVTTLLAEVRIGQAAVSAVAGDPQLSMACWPTVIYRDVLAAMRSGQRRWSTLLELTPHTLVEARYERLQDADDPQTLTQLLQRPEAE